MERLAEIDRQCEQRRAYIKLLKADGGDVGAAEYQLRRDERERADLSDDVLILENHLYINP